MIVGRWRASGPEIPESDDETSSSEGGFALVFFAIAIVALLGIAALVVDVGYWYLHGQKLQRAADAAALAGVVWVPGSCGNATSTADQTAQANGVPQSEVTVECPAAEPHVLIVTITDTGVPTFFAKVFGLDKISETRTSTAEYQPPVPLGSPENSFGTGGLSLDANGDTSNIWAAINGYCTSKENGDEYQSAFDATYDKQASPPDYQCSGVPNADGGDPSATDNYEYNGNDGSTAGYSYDIVTPSTAENLGVTTDPITVQAYDPAFEPTQCSGQPAVNDLSPFNPAGGQTVDQSLGSGAADITTDYTLYSSPVPLDPSFDTLEPASWGAQGDNPYVASSGDASSCGQWVNLFTIPAGSPDGDYRLQVTTPQSSGQNSDGSNSYSLRAYEGSSACDGNSCPWTRCSTITTDANYSTSCPVIQGVQDLSVYATQEATAAAGSQAACPSDAPSGATCGSFYLAQIDQSYAGHVLQVNLFDPGEGDKDIELLNPDGQAVSFFWNVTDDCPLPAPNAGSTDCAQDLGFADNPGDNGVGTELPVDGNVTPPTGIVSNSEFNDRHVQLTFGIPSDYTADDGGWWKIEYVSQGSGQDITDRTTWSVALGGSPIHLLPPSP